VDRVVASVGNTAITASDVEGEYRLELVLEGRNPSGAEPDAATLNRVRDRLIDRILLDEEVQADQIEVSADDPGVTDRLQALRREFPGEESFQASLRALGLDEQELREKLAQQEAILRLIDQRLRPVATVEPAAIETYYRDTLLPELDRQGQKPPPALDQVEDRIREILVQQKINQLLGEWLQTLRTRHEVRLDGSAQAESAP
jgi:peptidyl-prolyl cis-trans isomerase SurA